MTPGMILLVIVGAWGAFAYVVGEWALRTTQKQWAKWAAMLFVWWLPFWDIAPGLYYYYKAIREVGGVHIYRTVEADGYLDASATGYDTAWSYLRHSPYTYIEVHIPSPSPVAELTRAPGFYEFRLAPNGDRECAVFDALPNAATLRRMYGLKDRCVVAVRRDEPVSRYEVSRGTDRYPMPALLPAVGVSWVRVRDRSTEQTLAEANQISYSSWLSKGIGIPVWRHTQTEEGDPLRLRTTTVIKPEERNN